MVNQTERGSRWCHSGGEGRWLVAVCGSLLCLLTYSWGYAESSPPKEAIIEHLEFLGYECDQVDAGIRAKHPSKIHVYVTYAFGGIRMQTGFPGKSPHSDVGSRYLVTNALGKQLSVMQVYWSDEGNLFAMAWMPGMYEKARLALFMEAWDHDAILLRQSYDQLKPFLNEERNDSATEP